MPRTANISGRSRRLSLERRRQSTTRAMTSEGYCVRFSRVSERSLNCFAALAAAEPAIALGGALRALGHGLRPTFQAPHPRPPLCVRRPYIQPTRLRPGAVARAL